MSLMWMMPAFVAKGVVYGFVATSVTNNSTRASGQSTTNKVTIKTNGTVEGLYDTGGSINNTTTLTDWSSAAPNETNGANWHCRIEVTTHVVGHSQTNNHTGTWYQLNVDQEWHWEHNFGSGPDSESGDYTMELSDDAGSTVFDTCDLTVGMANEGP